MSLVSKLLPSALPWSEKAKSKKQKAKMSVVIKLLPSLPCHGRNSKGGTQKAKSKSKSKSRNECGVQIFAFCFLLFDF